MPPKGASRKRKAGASDGNEAASPGPVAATATAAASTAANSGGPASNISHQAYVSLSYVQPVAVPLVHAALHPLPPFWA